MPFSPYDIDLDRNPANFQPLTPLTFLERAASVFPDHIAIIHGALRAEHTDASKVLSLTATNRYGADGIEPSTSALRTLRSPS